MPEDQQMTMTQTSEPTVTTTTPAEGSTTPPGEGGQPPAPPPPVTPTPSQEELDFAKRFTALTRKEREILTREERIKSELQAVNEFKRNQDLIKTNPLKFLEQNGWDFNKLADFALNDQKPTQSQIVEDLQKQIQELRREREEEKNQSKQSEIESNIRAYKDNLKKELIGRGEKYELLNHYEEYDLVYETMNDHYQKTSGPNGEPGEVLDLDEVAAQVEKYLEDRLERATKTKKFSTRFAPSVKEEPKATDAGKDTGGRNDPPKTLTNEMVSASGSNDSTNSFLDDDASKRRAAKILEEMWARQKR